MRYYCSKQVQCPYYHQEVAQKLMCEGPVDKTTTQLSFTFKVEKTEYKKQHCTNSSGWKTCRIAKMLDDKWAENE